MGVPRDDHPTVALDPRTITGPSWPIVVMTLEQLFPRQGPLALKLGLLALLNDCTREMAFGNASARCIGEAQQLLDILRHMSWEPK